MRLAFFGSFYPDTQKAANSSTGMVILLSKRPEIEVIHLVVPKSARLPATVDASKIAIHPVWRHDNLLSLARALLALLRVSNGVDGYLFNIHMTSFGKTFSVNGFGLLVPPIVSKLTRKPVVVYMHNFYSTQDASKLGYDPGRIVRTVVRTLESVLLHATLVVVPLESQKRALFEKHHTKTEAVFLPYIESIHAVLLTKTKVGNSGGGPRSARFLLLGHWGPQKDLIRVWRVLTEIIHEDPSLKATVAGDFNVNFPVYVKSVLDAKIGVSRGGIEFMGAVSEDDLGGLIESNDILILPYSATGGYSGAMNTVAPWDLSIVAYDQPQLRETAGLLGLKVMFIDSESDQSIKSGIMAALRAHPSKEVHNLMPNRVLETSQSSLSNLLTHFKPQ